jgi:hypothetical protein
MRKLALAVAAALASQAARAEPYRALPRLAPVTVKQRMRATAAQLRAAQKAVEPVVLAADGEGPFNVIAIGVPVERAVEEIAAPSSAAIPTVSPSPTLAPAAAPTVAAVPVPAPSTPSYASPTPSPTPSPAPSPAPAPAALSYASPAPAPTPSPAAVVEPPALAAAPLPLPPLDPGTGLAAMSLRELTVVADVQTPSGDRVEVLSDGAGGILEIVRDRAGNIVAARNRVLPARL